MKLLGFVYKQTIYNYRLKTFVSRLLGSRLVYANPLYRAVYRSFTLSRMKRFCCLPERVIIENTNVCQAGCVFCPHKKMKRKKGAMSTSLYRRIIDQCVKFVINHVSIYGFGEPLLDKHFIDKIIYAKKNGIARVTTNTNAMYLNGPLAEAVIRSGLDEIYISFDAASKSTYRKIRPGLDFDTVTKNILHLLKARAKFNSGKPKVFLSFVVSKVNRGEVGKYFQKWQRLVDGISVSIIHNWTGATERNPFLSVGQRDPCRLLWTDMMISQNGEVSLCCQDYENKIVLGNVANENISAVWGGKKLSQIRRLHLKGKFEKISLCRHCQYNYHHKSPWWVIK